MLVKLITILLAFGLNCLLKGKKIYIFVRIDDFKEWFP